MSSHSLEMVPLFRPWLAELLRSLVVLGSVARAFTTFQNLDLSLFLPPFILRGFCVFFQGVCRGPPQWQSLLLVERALPGHSLGGPESHLGYCWTFWGGTFSLPRLQWRSWELGEPLSCLTRSLFFLLKWIQELSMAVRSKGLISSFLQGTHLCWTFRSVTSIHVITATMPSSVSEPRDDAWGLVLSSQTPVWQT